ncbi:unnamed protein product [Soboliphyme baturini]|uniref:Cysteine-rich motor neuron 1 protein n=1 Tax=Soboliphyme baturini TaxID=241478 RepID=A0A183IX32_9BILA|nr:unnamed protein product [Soboliphyme baturini]
MILWLVFFTLTNQDDGVIAEPCPTWGDWRNWTSECTWLPMTSVKTRIEVACGRNISSDSNSIPLPDDFQAPELCGYCSAKLRCRKRPHKENCASIDIENSLCTEYGNICELNPTARAGCNWQIYGEMHRQCIDTPAISDMKREEHRKLMTDVPEMSCTTIGSKCRCCCLPWEPNSQGTECVKPEFNQCRPWKEWTDWSQCLWFPQGWMVRNIRQHCALDYKVDIPNMFHAPEGQQFTEKCGFCSFRVRCRKRISTSGCL